MNAFLLEYLPIVIFLGISAALGLGFMLAAWVLAPKNPDSEKLSAYECGFNAFDDARMKFDVRFYLVSILFIIIDQKANTIPARDRSNIDTAHGNRTATSRSKMMNRIETR